MNKKKNINYKTKGGYELFLASFPFLLVIFLMCYLPATGWAYAFYDFRPGIPLNKSEFVGLENFLRMFKNPISRREFYRVMENTLAMGTLNMVGTIIPMFFAIAHNELRGGKYKKFVQTVTTIPNFIGWVLVYAIAMALFSMDSGVVNSLLKECGIIDKGINVLGSGEHTWVKMWLWSLWKSTGWAAIVYISGISSIDQTLYEAAAVDGAGRFSKIRYITIPGLMPTFVILLIMSIGNFLNTGMEQFYVFQNAFNKDTIEVLDLYVYNIGVGRGNDISYATAVGIMKSAIALILLSAANTISGKVRESTIF